VGVNVAVGVRPPAVTTAAGMAASPVATTGADAAEAAAVAETCSEMSPIQNAKGGLAGPVAWGEAENPTTKSPISSAVECVPATNPEAQWGPVLWAVVVRVIAQ
jgi:cytochrome c2